MLVLVHIGGIVETDEIKRGNPPEHHKRDGGEKQINPVTPDARGRREHGAMVSAGLP